MNLNQAAHGDREFGYIATRLGMRRKVVAGHVDDSARRASGSPRGSRRHRLARRAEPAARALRRQHARRRRHRRRPRRGTAHVRLVGPAATASTICADAVDAAPRARVDALVADYERSYDVAARAAARRRAPRSRCETRRRSRPACAASSRTAASPRSRRTSRTSAACGSCPGSRPQRLMADGYGFGAEGDWKTAALLRMLKVMGRGPPRRHLVHGGLHLPLRSRASRRSSARTCSRSARASAPRPAELRDPSARRSAAARTRSGWCSTPIPAPGFVVGILDLGDRFRLVANDDRDRAARRAAAEPARRARGVEARAEPRHLRRVLDHRRWSAPHGPQHRGRPRVARGPRHDRRRRARMDRCPADDTRSSPES